MRGDGAHHIRVMRDEEPNTIRDMRMDMPYSRDPKIRVPNSIFKHLIHNKQPHGIEVILSKIPGGFLKRYLRSMDKASPHVRLMRSDEGANPHVRVMRGDDEMSPTSRVLRSDEEMSPHIRVMRNDEEMGPHVRVMRSDEEMSPHTLMKRSKEVLDPHVRVLRNADAENPSYQERYTRIMRSQNSEQ